MAAARSALNASGSPANTVTPVNVWRTFSTTAAASKTQPDGSPYRLSLIKPMAILQNQHRRMSGHRLEYPRPNLREVFRPYETFAGIGPHSRLPRRQGQIVRISLEDHSPVCVSQTLQRSPTCPVSCVFELVGDREPFGIRPCS